MVVDAAGEDGRRDHRTRPGGDDDLFSGEFVAEVGAQQIASVGLDWPEAGVLAVHVDVGGGAAVVFAADPDRVDAAEDARDDVVPAHTVDVRVDTVAGRMTHGLGHLSGVDEHLGGNAPDVQTGAAECALLADRHPLARVAFVENAVARTGSDDRKIVGFHAAHPSPADTAASASATRHRYSVNQASSSW